jgi:hypothetical protein
LTPSSDLSASRLAPSPQLGRPVEIAGQPINGNVPNFASEEEYSQDEELPENLFEPQQQQALAERKPVARQDLGHQKAQESLDTRPSTTALNLYFNGKPFVEFMSNFGTNQLIFVFVFVALLVIFVLFTVLNGVFSFLHENSMYIFAALMLIFGGGALLKSRISEMESQVLLKSRISEMERQVDIEKWKTLGSKMERDNEMIKRSQWNAGGSGIGNRRLENSNMQRAIPW